MTLIAEIAHEARADHPAAVLDPGASSIPPDPTHWGFLLGFEAHRLGQPECPFAAGGMAAAQFQHGWADAEVDAAQADREFELQFEMNYCQPD